MPDSLDDSVSDFDFENSTFVSYLSQSREVTQTPISQEPAPKISESVPPIANIASYSTTKENMALYGTSHVDDALDSLCEKIFGFTISPECGRQYVFLNEFAANNPDQKTMSIDLLEQALFERLFLENPANHLCVIPTKGIADSHVVETECILYLFECFKRIRELQDANNKDIDKYDDQMKNLIFRNMSTALQQPGLYESQDLNSQIYQIFYNAEESISGEKNIFFYGIVKEMIADETDGLEVVCSAFKPVFDFIHRKIATANVVNFEHFVIFSFLQTMAGNPMLAEALITHSMPQSAPVGNVYSNTLLGAILCLSCLPKTNEGNYEFFDKPLSQTPSLVENTVWTAMSCIHDHLHKLFLALLKISPACKHKVLKWFGDCLHANLSRGKLWNAHAPHLLGDLGNASVSDGFMLNMSAVLLRLCEPFISNPKDSKILKIDPTYSGAKVESEQEAQAKGVHMHGLPAETCFVPLEEAEQRSCSTTFNFITECYFLAQKSIALGHRVCVDKLMRMNQDLGRIQRAYADAVAEGHEVAEAIQERMEAGMTRYLSLHAALIEPRSLELLAKLHVASARWLVQVILDTDDTPRACYAPQTMKELTFPLPSSIPRTLTCIPEFILENLTSFLSFVKRFNSKTLEECGLDCLGPIISIIIVFMGSCQRLRNPHLRAGLAESLEALLPKSENNTAMPTAAMSTFWREQLFLQHPHRTKIVPSLLDVFVGIEMTGQSVQFDQKFNYRMPMYVVMEYLWNIEEHRNCFKELAADAEGHMEDVSPPLFLRFLNHLLNDAVFLLDEALSNMAQLKTMQAARDSGDWTRLPPRDREQNETLFQHTGMMAKFDNILGRWTIHTLELITSEITNIFSHPVLVDRVAAMLNYILHHLVGPNKRNFKVKDQNEYDFKPAVIVLDICKIYVHLHGSDAFCLAISQDGRSYSSSLFAQAEDVLARIGGGGLIADLKGVAEKVSAIASRQQTEEELLSDAPEDFLDPIMSTLMTDPVLLPSSRTIVDRATIARHLLSDQSDPFNRSPLTMDMVKSHEELKKKIHAWIREKKETVGMKTKQQVGIVQSRESPETVTEPTNSENE